AYMANNTTLQATPISVYFCPSRRGPTTPLGAGGPTLALNDYAMALGGAGGTAGGGGGGGGLGWGGVGTSHEGGGDTTNLPPLPLVRLRPRRHRHGDLPAQSDSRHHGRNVEHAHGFGEIHRHLPLPPPADQPGSARSRGFAQLRVHGFRLLGRLHLGDPALL